MLGRYIVLEGGEGVGKTTQVALLIEHLTDLGVKAEEMHEPGGDALGGVIRSLVLDPAYDVDLKTEVLLFNAARARAMIEVERLLDSGIWVISDRSYISTLAYQGYARGHDLDELETICLYAVGNTRPDLILVLHCDSDETLNRRTGRGTTDRMEQAGEDFHAKVYNAFLDIAQRRSLPVIETDGSKAEVFQWIWAHIKPLVEE